MPMCARQASFIYIDFQTKQFTANQRKIHVLGLPIHAHVPGGFVSVLYAISSSYSTMLELAKKYLKKLSPVVIVHHYLILFPRRGPGFDPRPGKTNFEAHIPSTPRFQVAKMRHPPQREAMKGWCTQNAEHPG